MIFISVLVSYLLGSVPTAVWVGRKFYGIDVRTRGSGNAGATNTIRVLGWKAGVPVLLIDVFKGLAAVLLVDPIAQLPVDTPLRAYVLLASSVAVVLGHTFPLWAGFKGGKGVATLLGVGFGLFPLAALVALLIFIIVFAATRYVSLGSLTAGISFPFLVFFAFPANHWIFYALAIAVAVFLPLTHRKNIERLIQGKENKISFKNR